MFEPDLKCILDSTTRVNSWRNSKSRGGVVSSKVHVVPEFADGVVVVLDKGDVARGPLR